MKPYSQPVGKQDGMVRVCSVGDNVPRTGAPSRKIGPWQPGGMTLIEIERAPQGYWSVRGRRTIDSRRSERVSCGRQLGGASRRVLVPVVTGGSDAGAGRVTKSDMGKDWPLTLDGGTLGLRRRRRRDPS